MKSGNFKAEFSTSFLLILFIKIKKDACPYEPLIRVVRFWVYFYFCKNVVVLLCLDVTVNSVGKISGTHSLRCC